MNKINVTEELQQLNVLMENSQEWIAHYRDTYNPDDKAKLAQKLEAADEQLHRVLDLLHS